MKSFNKIILTLAILVGVSFYGTAQYLEPIKKDIVIVNDSTCKMSINYIVHSNVKLGKHKPSTWATFKGYKNEKDFWIATGCLAVGAGFFTAAAYSDPVVYVETHGKYTRDYYDKAIKKRNGFIIVGSVFTVGAAYFYYKLRGKKRTRWIVGPDGVKYSF